jgi:hypothetical protein
VWSPPYDYLTISTRPSTSWWMAMTNFHYASLHDLSTINVNKCKTILKNAREIIIQNLNIYFTFLRAKETFSNYVG